MTQFAKELEELRSTYLHALPAKVKRATKAWQQLTRMEWDAGFFKNVYRLFHNIAGGAGTYGYLAISSQARAVLCV